MTTPRSIALALSLGLVLTPLDLVPTFQAGLARAVDLPDLGESSRGALSELEEARVGREVMRQIRQNRDFLADAELIDYLNALGDRLAASSDKPYLRFEFFAVRDPSINAFALPGGYIGLHTGLITAVRNESELAGVVAHEIAHVTQHHIARMVDSQRAGGLATLAAMAVAILAARSNPEVSQAVLTTSQAMAVQSQLDFTRQNEQEADRVGLRILDRAGFDPAGMASFFERLMRETRFQESSAPGYLRTHPLSHQRMADMQDRVSSLPYRQHGDSLEFTLLRAKAQAEEDTPQRARLRFLAMAAERPRDPGTLYGLVHANLRAGEAKAAAAAFDRLAAEVDSPLLATLGARVDEALGRPEAAIDRLRAAQARHGASKPILYALVEALSRAGRADESRRQAEQGLAVWPDDARLLTLRAEAWFALGQPMRGHLDMAEAHIRNDLISAAMEQLRLAQRAGGGDFYTQSIVDARLRDLRQMEHRDAKP